MHDGYALVKGVVRSQLGGALLTDLTLRCMEAGGKPIRPRFSFKRKQNKDGAFVIVEEARVPRLFPPSQFDPKVSRHGVC